MPSTDMGALLEQDERGTAVPSDEKLRTVAAYATMLRDLEAEVVTLDEDLRSAKEDLQHVKTKLLPEALAAVGVTSLTLASGETVAVEEKLYASIPAANREEACAWLRSHGHGSIVKREVKFVLRGADTNYAEGVEALEELASSMGITMTAKEDVHTQTLTAFIKELRAEGGDVPDDVFKVYVEDVATVKRPRTPRATPRVRRT